MSTPKKVLIVEDEAVIALLIEQTLRARGYEICSIAISGEDAIDCALQRSPDLILMDIKLSGEMKGTTAAKIISEKVNVPIIFLTAHSDPTTRSEALESSPYGYLLKPFKADALISTIETAFRKYEKDTKIRENELKLEAVFNSSNLGIILINDSYSIVEMNTAALHLTGYTMGKVKGKPVSSLFVNLNGEETPGLLDKAKSTVNIECIKEDGSLFWGSIESHLMSSFGKSVNYWTIILQDISSQKKIKQQLEIVNKAVEITRVGILISNPSGEILFVNKAKAELYGYEINELIGKDIGIFDIQKRGQIPRTKITNDFNRVTLSVKKDGSILPVHLISNIVYAKGGKPDVIVTTCEDISEQYENERKLKESEQKFKKLSGEFQALVEGIQDSICLFSTDLSLTWANKSTERVFDLHVDNASKSTIAKLFGCKKMQHCQDSGQKCEKCSVLKTWHSHESHETITVYNDNKIIRRITFPFYNDSGEMSGIIQLARDITDQENLKKQAEFSSRLNSLGEIAAGLGHEINNPNGMIMLNAQLLSRILADLLPIVDNTIDKNQPVGKMFYRDIRPQIQDSVSKIVENSQRIKGLVESLRDFSIPSTIHSHDNISLHKVIFKALDLIRPTVKKYTNYLEVNLDKENPVVKGNFQRLEQVVVNLVLNAAQALQNPNEEIRIETRINSKYNNVTLVVKDDGKGIAEKDLEKIRLPFYSTKDKTGGSGLGLSIVERIVLEHNGTMHISSKQGEGCVVEITLPLTDKN